MVEGQYSIRVGKANHVAIIDSVRIQEDWPFSENETLLIYPLRHSTRVMNQN